MSIPPLDLRGVLQGEMYLYLLTNQQSVVIDSLVRKLISGIAEGCM
jgi:hypothetical protein